MKETIIRKLTSRKFWAAVVGFVTGLLLYLGKSEAQAQQIAALIMSAASVVAYIVGEGLADAAGAQPKPIEYTAGLAWPEEDHPPED